MPFITFIYKKKFDIDGTPGPFFGKYCTNSIHDELYVEVKKCLIQTLNDFGVKRYVGRPQFVSYRWPETEETVSVGVLSVSSDDIVTMNSNKKDIQAFHFYCDYDNNRYINGKLINNTLNY